MLVSGTASAPVFTLLDDSFTAAASFKPNKADWLEGKWSGMPVAPGEEDRPGETAGSGDLH